MIFIALGANLPTREFGPPRRTLEEALRRLAAGGCRIVASSQWYQTTPMPPSGQPLFVNAVVAVESQLTPEALLALLHDIEASLGRVRSMPNAARTVDLDLLAYGNEVRQDGPPPQLPHPRMLERRFVMQPLCDIAPDWHHPITGRTAKNHLADLPPDPAMNRDPEPL